MTAHQFSGKGRQLIVVTTCPAEFDTYIPPFDKAAFPQSLIEGCQCAGHCGGFQKSAQKTDYGSRPLSMRCGHPCRGPGEDRDEIPSPHSITSSANYVRVPLEAGILSRLLTVRCEKLNRE